MSDDLREAIARAIRTERLKAQGSAFFAVFSPDAPAEDADLAAADAILALIEARGLAIVPAKAPDSLRQFARAYEDYIAAAKVTP